MSLKSGARSPRVYGQLAEDLAAGLLAERPDLESYPEAVAGWATVEAIVTLLRRQVAKVGPVDDKGDPRPKLLSELSRWEKHARLARETLGLTPFTEARLSRERAAAGLLSSELSRIIDAGRAANAARNGAPLHPDLAGRVLAEVTAAGIAAAGVDGQTPPGTSAASTDANMSETSEETSR